MSFNFFLRYFFKFFLDLKINDSIEEVDFFIITDIFLYDNPWMFFKMYAVFWSLFKESIASNNSLESSFFSRITPGCSNSGISIAVPSSLNKLIIFENLFFLFLNLKYSKHFEIEIL